MPVSAGLARGDDGAGATAESARILPGDAVGLRALPEGASAPRGGEADESGECAACVRATGRFRPGRRLGDRWPADTGHGADCGFVAGGGYSFGTSNR